MSPIGTYRRLGVGQVFQKNKAFSIFLIENNMLECMTPKLCTHASDMKAGVSPNVFQKILEVPGQALCNLVTFHWCGGDKNAYRPFIKDWEADGICVWSFILPSRVVPSEKLYTLDEIASMFIQHLRTLTTKTILKENVDQRTKAPEVFFPPNKPLILLGHSLGAMLAYESARRLTAESEKFSAMGINLSHLIVSSASSPNILSQMNVRDAGKGYHTYTESDLFDHIKRLGGVPAGVDEVFIRSKMKLIRADFYTYHSYSMYHAVKFREVECRISGKILNARPQDLLLPETLNCDISCFAGAKDCMIDPSLMSGWNAFTTGLHHHTTFPGTHFYLMEEPARALFTQQVKTIAAACILRFSLLSASVKKEDAKSIEEIAASSILPGVDATDGDGPKAGLPCFVDDANLG